MENTERKQEFDLKETKIFRRAWRSNFTTLGLVVVLLPTLVGILMWKVPSARQYAKYIWTAVLVIAILEFLRTCFSRLYDPKLIVREDEIALVEGFLKKKSVEAGFGGNQRLIIHVTQNPWQSLLGMGNIDITASGDHAEFKFYDILNPEYVRNLIQARQRSRGGMPMSGSAGEINH